MPQIRFTKAPSVPRDKVNEFAKYIVDSVHNVSSDTAERWIRRGVAEIVTNRQLNKEIKDAETEVKKVIEEVTGEETPPETQPEIKEENKVVSLTEVTNGTPSVDISPRIPRR